MNNTSSAPNQLEQLKKLTTVVADTGDFERMQVFQPQDATTNPSLILKAAQQSNYQSLVQSVKDAHRGMSPTDLVDYILVAFGLEILKIVPGRVSTEVDARLSFDTKATVAKAKHIIALYESHGIERKRILIKLAGTWEGIAAAKELEAEGIHCNITLLFSLIQAAACGAANAKLISPFVGRITDWNKSKLGSNWSDEMNGGANDPGVTSVKKIFTYYKHFGISTEIMGASFRNTTQILELAGCDLLTISPELLAELQSSTSPVIKKLDADSAHAEKITPLKLDESSFRLQLNNDPMATEKLAEGIRNFCIDTEKLEALLAK
ncbi:transaldolase [Polynucleobacter sp. MG-5-Ahmo-C2]|jgi:transaldolase|uniref:transaldolase n=1 Tax=unclassified Polynucleobacter TaxID=2640945 RepID=UPI001BFE22DB|nr:MULTISPECIES: transaldolase [unclassified Polynucleobacter]QWD73047.1 transaldolase [Polynucleobacter sp. UB-Raua-W9]QWD99132.1 transaldolase [Polynucleobacter sp. MG-5-Ahmo-C2]